MGHADLIDHVDVTSGPHGHEGPTSRILLRRSGLEAPQQVVTRRIHVRRDGEAGEPGPQLGQLGGARIGRPAGDRSLSGGGLGSPSRLGRQLLLAAHVRLDGGKGLADPGLIGLEHVDLGGQLGAVGLHPRPILAGVLGPGGPGRSDDRRDHERDDHEGPHGAGGNRGRMSHHYLVSTKVDRRKTRTPPGARSPYRDRTRVHQGGFLPLRSGDAADELRADLSPPCPEHRRPSARPRPAGLAAAGPTPPCCGGSSWRSSSTTPPPSANRSSGCRRWRSPWAPSPRRRLALSAAAPERFTPQPDALGNAHKGDTVTAPGHWISPGEGRPGTAKAGLLRAGNGRLSFETSDGETAFDVRFTKISLPTVPGFLRPQLDLDLGAGVHTIRLFPIWDLGATFVGPVVAGEWCRQLRDAGAS